MFENKQGNAPSYMEDEQESFDMIANEPFSSETSVRSEETKDESKAFIATALSDTGVLGENSPFVDYSETEQAIIERERVYRDLMLEQQVLMLSTSESVDQSLKALEARKLFEDHASMKVIEDMSIEELDTVLEVQTLIEHFERELEQATNLESDYMKDEAIRGLVSAENERTMLKNIVQGINKEYGGFGGVDLAAHFVPFYSSQVYVSLARDVFGLEDLVPALGASAALDRMNTVFKEASFEEQLDYLGKFAEWAKSDSGLWMGRGNNRLAVSAAASEVFMRALEDKDASILEKRLLDVANALDVAGLGALVKGATGFGYNAYKLNQAAKQQALMAAKTDPDAAAKLRVDVLTAEANEIVPNPAVSPVVLTREQQDIVDYANMLKTESLTTAQRKVVEDKIKDLTRVSATAMETRLMKYDHSKSTFTSREGTLDIVEHYNTPVKVNNTRGKKELKDMLNTKFGEGGYTTEVVDGYLVVKRPTQMTFNSQVQDMAEFGIGDGAFASGLFSKSPFQVPEAKFGVDILKTLSLGRQSKELAARVSDNIKELNKLSAVEQRELNTLFRKYSGVEMPAEEFAKLNAAQKSAYAKVKEALDTMWFADNQLVRDNLVARGKMQLTVKMEEDTVSYIGKPLLNVEQAATIKGRAGADGLVDVLDQSTNTIVRINVDDAYAQGKYLFRVDDAAGLKSDVVLINRNLGKSDIVVGEIPFKVLNYRPNYVPRYYNKMYIVEKTNKDGKKVAVAATNSKKEAQMLVESNGGSGVASVRQSREASNMADTAVDSWGTNMRGVGLGTRGEGLVDISGNIAELDNAVEAITRAARSFGVRHGSREFIQTLKNRWVQSYPHLAQTKEGRAMFPSKLPVTADADRGAKALYDYINQIEGVQKAATAQGYMKVMQQFADIMEAVVPGAFGRGVASTINQLGMKDPTRGMRTVAFYTLLALNPTRQFWMQAQHSLLSANLVPQAAAPQKMYQGMMLQLAGSDGATKSSKAFYKKAAEASGMSGEEFDALLKLYKDLGIRRAVSSHYLVDDTVRTFGSVDGGFAGMAKNAAHYGLGVPLNFAKTIGFDAGNHVNAMGAFMAAVTKFQREAKAAGRAADLNTAAARDAIRADFDKYMWYMGREGTANYTEGLLGAAMQFFTIQHKGLVTMLPARYGGRTDMTGVEKARTGGALFALYGADGFGLVNIINKIQRDVGEEYLSDEVTQLLQQGVLGTFLSQLVGEDVDLGSTWSPVGNNMAAFSAGLITTLMKDDGLLRVYDNALNSLTVDTGKDFFPFFTALTRSVNIARNIRDITRYESDVFSSEEKFNAAIKEIATISGTMNNIQKMLIMNQFGKSYTSTGNVITDRENERHFLTALLGLQGVEERELFKLAAEVYNAGQRDMNSMPDASQAGRDFYNQTKVLLMKHQENFDLGTVESQEALNAIMQNHALKYISDDSSYKMSFMDGFSNAMLNDTGDDAVTRMVINNISSRVHQLPISRLTGLKTSVANLNAATKGKYQEIEDLIDTWIEQRKDIDRQFEDLNERGE